MVGVCGCAGKGEGVGIVHVLVWQVSAANALHSKITKRLGWLPIILTVMPSFVHDSSADAHVAMTPCIQCALLCSFSSPILQEESSIDSGPCNRPIQLLK